MHILKIIEDEYRIKSGKKNLFKAVRFYLWHNEFRCRCKIRDIVQTHSWMLRHIKIEKLERKYGIYVGENSHIGENFEVGHFAGTVIGDKVVIGDNCMIYHQVTIGQKRGIFPQIGNNVVLYPGCKVIGEVKIGDNVIVAPNAVVIENIPDNSIAVGIPARIIKREEK